MHALNLLALALIICFIVDISGIIESIKYFISKLFTLKVRPEDIMIHPFDCSLCLIFWAGLIYLLVMNKFNLIYILFICVLSLLSTTFTDLLLTCKDLLDLIIKKINNLIQ